MRATLADCIKKSCSGYGILLSEYSPEIQLENPIRIPEIIALTFCRYKERWGVAKAVEGCSAGCACSLSLRCMYCGIVIFRLLVCSCKWFRQPGGISGGMEKIPFLEL